MKTNILATRPMTLQKYKYTLTAFNSNKSRRQQIGVIKLLPPSPQQPDEKTVMELNALAARHPFCILHKVKRHDPL